MKHSRYLGIDTRNKSTNCLEKERDANGGKKLDVRLRLVMIVIVPYMFVASMDYCPMNDYGVPSISKIEIPYACSYTSDAHDRLVNLQRDQFCVHQAC